MHDIIIIGAGAAGLSTAIYSTRYNLNTVVIANLFGGLANEAHNVENWPGIKSITGAALMRQMKDHAESLGAQMVQGDVVSVSKKVDDNGKPIYAIETAAESYEARSIVLAMGSKRRKLNIPGESELYGKGVSYCATCDGAFFREKVVGVVGGNDSAVMSAELLAQYASKVYIIYRREKVRAAPMTLERAEKNPKIKIINNANVLSVNGNGKVESVTLDREYDGARNLAIDGLFIEIGNVPATDLAKAIGVRIDEGGYIVVDSSCKTSVDGVFAAGDITTGSDKFKQIITAAAEGAKAAKSAYEYMK